MTACKNMLNLVDVVVFVDKMVSPMLLLYARFSVWNEFLAEIWQD